MSPRIRRILLWAIGLAVLYGSVVALTAAGIITSYYQATLATICINIILAASLNLITGFTGQFSLGHAGFMSIGAYSTAVITMRYPTVWGFLAGIALGAILAAIVGVLVGLPTLRLKGDYLAIATLGMAEIIRIVLLNTEFSNGAAGLNGIPQFTNWTWLFIFTVATIVIIANFLRSSPGRDCVAVREDEIAAESIGVNATLAKTRAFAIGAAFGAVAGSLYSSYFYFIKPDLFGFLKSIDILVIVVLGGLGSLSGSVIAAILLAVVSTLLQPFPEIRMILYALVLVVIMIFRPQGIMGSREISLGIFRRFKRPDAVEATP